MKLYEIPKESKLKVKTERSSLGEVFTFHNIDGAYSLCTSDVDGKYLYLSASTPLELKDSVYSIKETV